MYIKIKRGTRVIIDDKEYVIGGNYGAKMHAQSGLLESPDFQLVPVDGDKTLTVSLPDSLAIDHTVTTPLAMFLTNR